MGFKIEKVIIKGDMPKGCRGCKLAYDMSKHLRENERLTGTSHYCYITKDLLYQDDWETRPDWCPLEKESKVE